MAGRVELSEEKDKVKAPRVSPAAPLMESDADHHIKTAKAIPDQVVVAFFEELDGAQQHLDFVDDLFRLIPSEAIPEDLNTLAFTLALVNQEHGVHPLLNFSDFRHYVKNYFVAKNVCLDPNYIRTRIQKKEAYRCSSPAFDLLFKARHHGYVLEKDPRVELEKLQKYSPTFYGSLVCRKPPVDWQARTVTVSNLSDEILGKDIWRFFIPCGDVEYFETKSGPDGQIAEITFKDLCSAKFAAEFGLPASRRMLQHEDMPLLVKLNTTVSAVKEAEDVSSMYATVMHNYRRFRIVIQRHLMNQIKRNIVTHYGECWNFCEWMQLEALADGGFTTEGEELASPCRILQKQS